MAEMPTLGNRAARPLDEDMKKKLEKLRLVINEGLRVQKGGAAPIEYVDVINALTDMKSRQNHVVYGRRGCGKTLLLHSIQRETPEQAFVLYLNLEDFKRHTFPNILIEILVRTLSAMQERLKWHKPTHLMERRRLDMLITKIKAMKETPDSQQTKVRTTTSKDQSAKSSASAPPNPLAQATIEAFAQESEKVEKEYDWYESKLQKLDNLLPELKDEVTRYFQVNTDYRAAFIELDDFYLISRPVQPHVMDFVHQFRKDTPLFFKVATRKHSTTLFIERQGQPTGAQQRHDFQPINVDFQLSDFSRTANQLRRILYKYGERAGMTTSEIDLLFKGDGFERLVLASGGVPRDFLSTLIEMLGQADPNDYRIGKDTVRYNSQHVWLRRIEDMKTDSAENENQESMMKATFAIKSLCVDKKSNVFLVAEKDLQENLALRNLLNALADYSIIHFVASSLTHKTKSGTFSAYMIDIGAYANMRNLVGANNKIRFKEIDVSSPGGREEMRNGPILEFEWLRAQFANAPSSADAAGAPITDADIQASA